MRFICVICGLGVSHLLLAQITELPVQQQREALAVSHQSPPLVAGSPGLDSKSTSFLLLSCHLFLQFAPIQP